MSAKTKIVVLHKKEVCYAGILTLAGLFLVLLFFSLFLTNKDQNAKTQAESSKIAKNEDSPEASSKAVVSTDLAALPQSGILQETLPAITYVPGIYKTELILGGQSVEVEAVLEKDRITSLRLVDPGEAITTMYPLLEPTMSQICEQIYASQSLEGLKMENNAKYTSLVLLEAIRCCLEKGTP